MHAEKPVTIPMIGLVRLAIQNAIPVIKKVIGSRFAPVHEAAARSRSQIRAV
jgi:hypothetical protein